MQNYLFACFVLENCAYIHGKLHICKNHACAVSVQIINGIFALQNCIFAHTNIYFKIITILIYSPGYLPDLPTSPLPMIPPPPDGIIGQNKEDATIHHNVLCNLQHHRPHQHNHLIHLYYLHIIML